MKKLIYLYLLLLSDYYAFSGIAELESATRRPDGYYDIVCTNGSQEIATIDQLKNEIICGGPTNSARLNCTGFEKAIYLTRISDGKKLGSKMAAGFCREIVDSTFNDITCTTTGNNFWYVTEVNTGRKLGQRTNFENCINAARTARGGITCKPYGGNWRIAKTSNFQTIGISTTSNLCFYALQTSRQGVTCAKIADGRWAPHRIYDSLKLGFQTNYNSCFESTMQSRYGRVCANYGGNRWRSIDISSAEAVSPVLPLDACVVY